jgi:hypothetical protein
MYEVFNDLTSNYVGPFADIGAVIRYARSLPEDVRGHLSVEVRVGGPNDEYKSFLTAEALAIKIAAASHSSRAGRGTLAP